MKLSDRQRALLRAIDAHIQAHGYSPSYQELMAATGTSSTSVVSYNLRGLRDLGLVTFVDDAQRTVRITVAGYNVLFALRCQGDALAAGWRVA